MKREDPLKKYSDNFDLKLKNDIKFNKVVMTFDWKSTLSELSTNMITPYYFQTL